VGLAPEVPGAVLPGGLGRGVPTPGV
jgi:hypothetical protein